MPDKITSTRNHHRRLSSGLGYLLFSEKMIFRWLRFGVLLCVILGCGLIGTWIFEMDQDGFTALNIIRYALAPFAAAVSVLLLGARYLQDIYELPSYSYTLRYLFASMFDGPPYFLLSGSFLPNLNISDGKAENNTDGDINPLQRIGGPGWLFVERGNVVLLEYLHSPAKVLGPGFHFIPRLLHVEEIFNLEDQHWEATPIVATTKDGIEVAVHDFQFGYRLAAPSGNTLRRRTTIDPYPYSAKSVWKLAYGPSVAGDGKRLPWGKWIQNRLDGVITDYINTRSIDEIIAPTSARLRQEVLNKISSGDLRKTVIDAMGTEVTWLNIGSFDIHDEKIGDEIKDYRLRAWFAGWAGKASLIRAEGKAEQISQTEGGRIEKTTSMLRGILQALEDVRLEGDVDEHVWNIVLARTAQIIEAMTSRYGIEISGLNGSDTRKGSL